jgi:hemoglobin
MYPPHDLAGAEARLRDFLIYRFGGPTRYIEQRGHPRLRARHAPFGIDQNARDRWMQLMGDALAESALPPEVRDTMRQFLDGIATFLINRASSG